MSAFSRLSIRSKLTVIIMSITSVTLILTGVAISLFNIKQEKLEIYEGNLLLAKLIANRSTAAIVFDDTNLATENLESLRNMHDITNACIYQDDGELFAQYHRIKNSDTACPKLKNLSLDIAVFKNSHLQIATTITLKDEILGYIFFNNNLKKLDSQTSEDLTIIIIFTIIASIIALLLTNILQKIISKPIIKMKKIVSEVESTKNYLLRTNAKGQDEISQLGKAFNTMLETIETQQEDLINTNINLEVEVTKRTKELQLANRELESFNYSVSHDLRAPLRAISGFSQIVNEDYSEILDNEGKKLLSRIQDNTRHMVELIEALLTLSRLGRAEINYSTINLSEMALNIINTLKELDPKRHIEFSHPEKLTATGDPILVKVVFDNLLSNAWKYTSKQKNTKIEFGQLIINGEKTFFITDNGAGFDMNFADKLFSAFSRLHSRDEFPGTGIGLATVRRIINRHEGRIWAESKPNEGATFYFILPDHSLS